MAGAVVHTTRDQGRHTVGSDSVLTELEPAREQERMDKKGFFR